MAHLLGAENIRHEFPTKVVFDGITIGVNEGDRIGVVGRNGDGKSTLLKVLAKRLVTDEGRVTYRSDLRVGMLDQQDVLDPTLTVGVTVVAGREEHEWAGDAKVRDVIAGLVNDLDWNARIEDLSGGQKRRVALAKLLTQDWDVVLLDEPTNHLDLESIQSLNNSFIDYKGILIFHSHDHEFINTVANRIIEIGPKGMIDKHCSYDEYLEDATVQERKASIY